MMWGSAGGERWAWFGAGVVAASLGFVAYLFFVAPAGGPRPAVAPRPTPAPIAVHVAGEVLSPGVYQVSSAMRVEDALQLAGGVTEAADLSQLNLAARVTDGQRIAVPRRASPAATPGPVVSTAGPTAAEAMPAAARVNLNTATLAELDALPGIGPVTAGKILEQRQKAPFVSVDQLLELKIVNTATFARIRDLVTAE